MALLSHPGSHPSSPERLRALLEHIWLAIAHVALGSAHATRRLVGWYAADRARLRATLGGVAVLLVVAVAIGLGVGFALTRVAELLVATVEGALTP